MKCPSCAVDLRMSERQGVEIDYCPQCRGVWLDRGELDKIIDRANADTGAILNRQERPAPDEYKYRDPRRRKSFLKELFDFD